MNTTSKRPFSFTRLLRLACMVIEVLIAVGLVITAGLAPFAESFVSSGSQVTIAKSATTGEFTYRFHLFRRSGITVTNEKSALPDEKGGDAGGVSVGPFALKAGEGSHFLVGPDSGKNVSVQKVEAMVTFKGPERTVEALHAFKWPAVIGELCAILVGLAFFDMLRRLLASAEKGDLFTESNVAKLRQIGFLIIVLDLVKFGATTILVSRMNSFVAPFLSDGTWLQDATVTAKLTGFFSGLALLLLAEVFREGLKFRKDSDLTI